MPAGGRGSLRTGTIAASTIPGVIAFTESLSGAVHYVGLVAGGTIANGSVAVVKSTSGGASSNGIFGVTSN